MKRMFLDRYRNDPVHQVTTGKIQVGPQGGIPPATTRRATGPLENIHGIEVRKDRFGMYRPVRSLQVPSGTVQVPHQVSSGTGQAPVSHRKSPDKSPVRKSSGKAQVNRQVSSGTGRRPDKSPVAPVKRRKTPANRKRAYKKTKKFWDYHDDRRRKFARIKNDPELKKARYRKKLEGYRNILKSQNVELKRQKKLLETKLQFCHDYGEKLRARVQKKSTGTSWLNHNRVPERYRNNLKKKRNSDIIDLNV